MIINSSNTWVCTIRLDRKKKKLAIYKIFILLTNESDLLLHSIYSIIWKVFELKQK